MPGEQQVQNRFLNCCSPLAGGMLIGLAFGVGVKWLLKWMRRKDAGRDQQICLTLAAAYLCFYIANSPAAVSGDGIV